MAFNPDFILTNVKYISDKALSVAVIKAGITPKMCEQMTLPKLKTMFEEAGFEYSEMKRVMERWDMDNARKMFFAERKNREQRNKKNQQSAPAICAGKDLNVYASALVLEVG